MTTDQRTASAARIIDAKFKVIVPKGRPKFAAGWSEEEFQAWKRQPFWRRYHLTFNWPGFWMTAAIAAGLALKQLMQH